MTAIEKKLKWWRKQAKLNAAKAVEQYHEIKELDEICECLECERDTATTAVKELEEQCEKLECLRIAAIDAGAHAELELAATEKMVGIMQGHASKFKDERDQAIIRGDVLLKSNTDLTRRIAFEQQVSKLCHDAYVEAASLPWYRRAAGYVLDMATFRMRAGELNEKQQHPVMTVCVTATPIDAESLLAVHGRRKAHATVNRFWQIERRVSSMLWQGMPKQDEQGRDLADLQTLRKAAEEELVNEGALEAAVKQ